MYSFGTLVSSVHPPAQRYHPKPHKEERNYQLPGPKPVPKGYCLKHPWYPERKKFQAA